MKKKKLIDQFKEEIRRRNYSYSTEKTYSQWIIRFVRFHNLTHPSELNEKDNDNVVYRNYPVNQRKWRLTLKTKRYLLLYFYTRIPSSPCGRLKMPNGIAEMGTNQVNKAIPF